MSSVLIVSSHNPTGVSGASLDIEVCSFLGLHPAVVYASITTQSLNGCGTIHPIDSRYFLEQLESLFSSFSFRVVKIGMMYSSILLKVLMDFLSQRKNLLVVMDPVISSSFGVSLVEGSFASFLDTVVSYALHIDLLIPNRDEAEKLVGTIDCVHEDLCQRLYQSGFRNVLLTGGHYLAEKDSLLRDYFYDGKIFQTYTFISILESISLRGTGCTLSTAIACFLTKNYSLEVSILLAKNFLLTFLKHKLKQLDLISL